MKYIDKTYLGAVLIIALIVYVFGLLLDYSFAFKPMYYVRCTLDGSLFALPVLLVWGSTKRLFAIGWCILFAIFILVNYSYLLVFNNFMPLECYTMFHNVNSVLIDSFLFSLKKGWLVLLPLAFVFLIKKGSKDKYRFLILVAVLFSNMLFITTEYCITVINLKIKNQSIYNRYEYDDFYFGMPYFLVNGLTPYLYCFVKTGRFTSINTRQYDYNAIDISSLPKYTDNRYAYAKGKSLIIIFVESLSASVINRKIKDGEICPTLNRLFNDSTNISSFFNSQAKAGASSDGHFIVNTGLLTLRNNVTANVISEVPSLAKSKKWASAIVVTTDDKYFWNQYATSLFYGYKENYYNEHIKKDGGYNDVIDPEVFDYGLKKVIERQNPFIAQFVTISMHLPFHRARENVKWIMDADTIPETTRKYWNCTHFFDNCLNDFLNGLKSSGKYDDCVIAIMGDHSIPVNIVDDDHHMSAVIILNSGCPKDSIPHPKNMQQIDIYPTLLDLIGGNEYGWKGVGHSIFRSDEPNDEEALYDLSQKLILSEYFQKTKF